jgi:hypothetical protein
MESGVITLQDIFRLDQSGEIGDDGILHASLTPTGIRPAFGDTLKAVGITIPGRLLGGDPIAQVRAR